jgi:hypothetical protein
MHRAPLGRVDSIFAPDWAGWMSAVGHDSEESVSAGNVRSLGTTRPVADMPLPPSLTHSRLCSLGRIIVGIGRVLKVDPPIEYSPIFSAPDRQTAIRPRNIPVPSGMLLRSTPTNPAASIQPRYCDSV